MHGNGRLRVAVLGLIVASMLGALVPSANAAFVSPTPAEAATVKGNVELKDNVRNQTRVSCANPGTTSGATNKFGGITKFKITRDSDASVVAEANVPNDVIITIIFNITLVSTGNALWKTAGLDRGAYTVTRTSYARANNASIPCTEPCPPNMPVMIGGTQFPNSCAPAAALSTQSAGSDVRHYNLDNETALSIATGQFGSADEGGTTSVQAKLSDKNVSGGVVANKTVHISLDGVGSQDAITGANGIATATFDTSSATAGFHDATASFDEDSAWRASSTGPVPVKIAASTTTTYTGDTEVFWNDNFAASANVTSASGMPDGTVNFKYPNTSAAAVPRPLDGAGNASTTYLASQNPGTAVSVTASYLGTEVFNPSSATQSILIKKRLTSLTYSGPTVVRWGEDVTVAADLFDVTHEPAVPMAGRTITFTLGSQTLTAVTDALGHAEATTPATSDVGNYPATASYAGDARYEAAMSAPISVRIENRYEFEDLLSPAKVLINPATRQFKYQNPSVAADSGDRRAPLMLSIFLPVDLAYPGLPALPVIPDNPLENLDNSPTLDPTISFKTISDLIAFLVGAVPASDDVTLSSTQSSSTGGTGSGSTSGAQSANTSAIEITDPHVAQPDDVATNPIPIGGFTIRQLLEKLTSGNYPTDLDSCQVLTGSTCERRLVVLVYPTESDLTTVGVFDIRSGLFLALNNYTDGARLMLDLGGCLNLDVCLRLPSTPTSLPDLLSAIPGLPVIPTDFFQPLPTLAPGSLVLPLSDLPPLGDVVVPAELPGTGIPVVGDPVELVLGAAEPLGLGDLGLPDLSDPAGFLADLGVPLEDVTIPLGELLELLGLPALNDAIINITIADLNAQLAPLTADLPATLDGAINDALVDNGVPDTAGLAALVEETLVTAGLGGGIPSLDSISVDELVAPVVDPILVELVPAIEPVLAELGLPPVSLASDSSTASTAGASTSAIPVPAPGGTLSPVNDVFTLLGLPTEVEAPDLAEQLGPVNDAVNDLDTSALAIPDLEEQLQPINDAINTINETAGSEVIPPIEVPGLPTLPDTDTLAGLLMEQVNLAAANLQTTPERILNLVLDFYVPTPAEAGTYVSGTLQQVIDRLTGNAVIGGDNSGILGLPEVAVGQITHLVVDIMSTACETGGTTAAPDATNWKLLTTSCAPTGEQIDVIQSCTDPSLNRDHPDCVATARPFEFHENNTIAQYTISRSPYVPAMPGIIGLNPLIIALPLALGLSPVDAPEPVLDLIQPLAAAPLLVTTLQSKLINVQGDGWTDATGSHGAGNQVLGQSVDTHPKETSPADPFPLYLPFYNGTILAAEPDHAIDFIGFGEPVVNTHTCLNTFEKEEQVNGKWMSTYRGGVGFSLFGSWVNVLGLCPSVLTMLTSAGIATFNGSPVDFKNDLAPLWSPVPPGADVAIALMVNTLEGILPADLLTGALGLLGDVPDLPSIPGVPAIPGLPEVPGVPEVPEVPTVP